MSTNDHDMDDTHMKEEDRQTAAEQRHNEDDKLDPWELFWGDADLGTPTQVPGSSKSPEPDPLPTIKGQAWVTEFTDCQFTPAPGHEGEVDPIKLTISYATARDEGWLPESKWDAMIRLLNHLENVAMTWYPFTGGVTPFVQTNLLGVRGTSLVVLLQHGVIDLNEETSALACVELWVDNSVLELDLPHYFTDESVKGVATRIVKQETLGKCECRIVGHWED